MTFYFGLAVYVICWWIVLFTILPLRIGQQPADGMPDPIADAAGAPHAPNLRLKFIVTTIVSALIFAAIYAVFAFELVKLDDLPFLKI
jgi:predicted secreted protein